MCRLHSPYNEFNEFHTVLFSGVLKVWRFAEKHSKGHKWRREVQLPFVIGVFLTFKAFICNASSMLAELEITALKVRKIPMTKSKRTPPPPLHMCVNSSNVMKAHHRTGNRIGFVNWRNMLSWYNKMGRGRKGFFIQSFKKEHKKSPVEVKKSFLFLG